MQQKLWTHAQACSHSHVYTQPLCKFKWINSKDFLFPASKRLAELAACSLKDAYGNSISLSFSLSLPLSLSFSSLLSLSLSLSQYVSLSFSFHLYLPSIWACQ